VPLRKARAAFLVWLVAALTIEPEILIEVQFEKLDSARSTIR